jgi:two-component system phosphate regulon sensor histidine kinase PhoR
MNRKAIYGLIALMSLALVGIITIQYFVIKSAIDLRKEQFNRSVMSAMVEVTHQLQKEKALDRFNQFNLGRIEIISKSGDSLDYIFVDIDGKTISNENIDQNVIKESKILGEGWENEEEVHFKPGIEVKSESDDDFYDDEHKLESNDSIMEITIQGLQLKYEIYKEMVDNLEHIESSLIITERVDSIKLSRKLTSALLSRGIDSKFVYGLLTIDKNNCAYCGPQAVDYSSEINKSSFKVSLFPGELSQYNHMLSLYFPNLKWDLMGKVGIVLTVSGLFILIVIGVFITAIKIIFKQKKLSEIKNDFISNMTHELKTPISTISLACEALEDKSIDLNQEIRSTYLGMIRSENSRLGMLVEKVLRNTVLDKGELMLKPEPMNLNEMVNTSISHFELQVRKNGGNIKLKLDENLPSVDVDPIHMANVISNLIDNAIKYSGGKPKIVISTTHNQKEVIFKIKDNGIGISPENQKDIFGKFYRVPTGNIHNVKGFGLGLSYVKSVVEKTGGLVSVNSEIKKGSTFTIKIPLNHD